MKTVASYPALVVHGQKLGRRIGFPTANLEFLSASSPEEEGVYAARLQVGDTLLGGMLNIGHRPTVGGEKKTAEIHLFDFDGDLYGQEVRLFLVGYIRCERKFSDLQALQACLEEDKQRALALLTQ